MPFPISVSIEEFELRLQDLLESRNEAISEYDLIQQLRGESLFVIDDNELLSDDSLLMFRIHFTLFHALYRLRDRLHELRRYELEMSPLAIELRQYRAGNAALTEHDPLREYYTDLSNLEQTGADEVDEMLQRFWLRLNNSERRDAALKELQLEDPVDNEEIRKQYRRLAMQYHPDRGGDKESLQRINAALSVLLNSYTL